MIGDFIDEHLGLVIVLLFAVVVGGIIWAINEADHDHDRRCAGFLQLAQTRRDTLDVRMRCELGSDQQVTPVIAPGFIPSR